jgi:glycosidase
MCLLLTAKPAGYFVTFLDNHDQGQRFGFTGPRQLQDQISLGMGVLSSLQGIPCFYYGTEQRLSGHKDAQHQDDSMVREALWGKPNGFGLSHPPLPGASENPSSPQ